MKEITSVDYITHLAFEYAETYSFQRGELYDELHTLDKKRACDVPFSAAERVRQNALAQQLKPLLPALLLQADGQLHPTAQFLFRIEKDSDSAHQLRSILQTEVLDIPYWMCLPFYRDGIIFYNKQKEILSVLNICLECEALEIENKLRLNADVKTYALLRTFLLSLGHKIEEW